MFEEGSPLVSHRWLVRTAVVLAMVMVIAGFRAGVWYVNAVEEEYVLASAGVMGQFIAVVIAGLLIAWRRGYITSRVLPLLAFLGAGSVFIMTTSEWVTAYRFGTESEINASSYALAATAFVQTVICGLILLRPAEEVSESNTDWERGRLPGR